MNQLYPNLVKVPETICSFDFIAFTKNKKISLPRQWESLKPYSVAIITGWKILEENVIARHVVKVDTPQMLFNHLDKERVDLIVYNRHEGYGVIHEMNFEHVFPVEPPLASRQMFLYLNKKHQVFVHEVAAAIRQMKEDGSFDEIVRHSLEAYIP
ncbi:MAG: transporter substrate-binding domain-containing protein [Desulfobacter sp.]|nr:transporter substrate-binding domain-containing protein [Desulfobacter sp.]